MKILKIALAILAGVVLVSGVQAPTESYSATAYCLKGRTASGEMVRRGIIAADRRVLPIGTVVRIEGTSHSGEYVVKDTGGAIKGNRIDIWTPTCTEAKQFGRKNVKLTVLSIPKGKVTKPLFVRPKGKSNDRQRKAQEN